jgi:hypothetical protein
MSPGTNRRSVLKLLAQCLLVKPLFAGPVRSPWESARTLLNSPTVVLNAHFRRYRVRATVSLLSVPLVSKDCAGAACILVEQLTGETTSATAIQLAGGSWPESLRGFNRFGMTQEVVSEEKGAIVESAYVSFMTGSSEKTLDQAKSSFRATKDGTPVSVARGSSNRVECYSCVEHVAVPAQRTWLDCPQMMKELLSQAPSMEPANVTGALPTFLHAVRSRMIGKTASPRQEFVHNAKSYTLHSAISTSDGLSHLSANILNQSGHKESEFSVWFEPGDPSGLPVRIDFRPRNFLRLVFEQDSDAGGPDLRPLIPREDV